MKIRPLTLLLAALGTLAVPHARSQDAKGPLTPIEDTPGLPRVLLIGDSISIGYTLPVRALLQGQANVHRPNANCGPTTNGVKNLDAWLATGGADKKWDVIHFNFGLHDLKYMGPKGENLANPTDPANQPQVSPADYEKNLREIVARLKKTGARLIWRNTTPIPQGAKGRLPGDDEKYNQIAARIMTENAITIDDLYSFAKPRLAEIQNKADVHFSAGGSQKLAGQVAAAIRKALE